MKHIYIDFRFRTKNSKSENNLCIELPRSFNVPDGVVAHIDDIVLPVSWTTIDERNRNCYISVSCGASVRDANLACDSKNYEGANFETDLAAKLDTAVAGFVPLPVVICTYDVSGNVLTISMADARNEAIKALTPIKLIKLQIITDGTLTLGPPGVSNPSAINTIIRNTVQTLWQ